MVHQEIYHWAPGVWSNANSTLNWSSKIINRWTPPSSPLHLPPPPPSLFLGPEKDTEKRARASERDCINKWIIGILALHSTLPARVWVRGGWGLAQLSRKRRGAPAPSCLCSQSDRALFSHFFFILFFLFFIPHFVIVQKLTSDAIFFLLLFTFRSGSNSLSSAFENSFKARLVRTPQLIIYSCFR